MLSTNDKLFILARAIDVSVAKEADYKDIYREMVALMWEYDVEKNDELEK